MGATGGGEEEDGTGGVALDSSKGCWHVKEENEVMLVMLARWLEEVQQWRMGITGFREEDLGGGA